MCHVILFSECNVLKIFPYKVCLFPKEGQGEEKERGKKGREEERRPQEKGSSDI